MSDYPKLRLDDFKEFSRLVKRIEKYLADWKIQDTQPR